MLRKANPDFLVHEWCQLPSFCRRCSSLLLLHLYKGLHGNISMGLAEILVPVERKTCVTKIAFCVNRDLAICYLQVESHQKGGCKWRPFFRTCVLYSMFWCVTLSADICEIPSYVCFGDGLILRLVIIRNYPWFQAELKGNFGIHALSYLTAWVCIADQW